MGGDFGSNTGTNFRNSSKDKAQQSKKNLDAFNTLSKKEKEQGGEKANNFMHS